MASAELNALLDRTAEDLREIHEKLEVIQAELKRLKDPPPRLRVVIGANDA